MLHEGSKEEQTLNNILVYNSNKMHKSQSLFNLTTALHISGVRHPQHTQISSNSSTTAADSSTV
jgi:hypothetical protein